MIQFRLRIKQRTFLVGGDLLSTALDARAHLYVRVDEAGEAVTLTSRKGAAAFSNVGKLSAGESMVVPLEGLTAVVGATSSPFDTFVDCVIVIV